MLMHYVITRPIVMPLSHYSHNPEHINSNILAEIMSSFTIGKFGFLSFDKPLRCPFFTRNARTIASFLIVAITLNNKRTR